MRVPVLNQEGKAVGEVLLPRFFDIEIVRTDLIRRVFVHLQTHSLQPKGRYPDAGDKPGAEYFGTGLGLARVPRIVHPPLRGRAAVAPMTRGGRRPHVTTPEKKIRKEVNKREKWLALTHAIAATGRKELVAKRGHVIDNVPHLPVVVSEEFEEISRTKELVRTLSTLGMAKELERVRENVKIVGGKASWRGRRRKIRIGPLIVYGLSDKVALASRNIRGVDVAHAHRLSVLDLAPGGVPGRLTIWTVPALEIVEKRLTGRVREVALRV